MELFFRKHLSCLDIIAIILGGVIVVVDSFIEMKVAIALGISIATFYLAYLRPRLAVPELHLHCEIQPSLQLKGQETDTDIGSYFLRFEVRNTGHSAARNCYGRLIQVWGCPTDDTNTTFERIERFDPYPLYWSKQNEFNEKSPFKPITIQPNGDFFFLDLAQVMVGTQQKTIKLRVETYGERLILDSSEKSGVCVETTRSYKVQVGIYADGISKKPEWYLMKVPESIPDRVVKEDIDHITFESTTAPEGAS